jgi:hypothetical protein
MDKRGSKDEVRHANEILESLAPRFPRMPDSWFDPEYADVKLAASLMDLVEGDRWKYHPAVERWLSVFDGDWQKERASHGTNAEHLAYSQNGFKAIVYVNAPGRFKYKETSLWLGVLQPFSPCEYAAEVYVADIISGPVSHISLPGCGFEVRVSL